MRKGVCALTGVCVHAYVFVVDVPKINMAVFNSETAYVLARGCMCAVKHGAGF